jgi:low affinity Fe/Cu permease
MKKAFVRLTTGCARFTGTPAMLLVCVSLSVFGVTADIMGNDHLVNAANLSISVLTLLILPILQASQNRDGAALQAKLDELIRVSADARDAMIGLENRSDDEIEAARSGRASC